MDRTDNSKKRRQFDWSKFAMASLFQSLTEHILASLPQGNRILQPVQYTPLCCGEEGEFCFWISDLEFLHLGGPIFNPQHKQNQGWTRARPRGGINMPSAGSHSKDVEHIESTVHFLS